MRTIIAGSRTTEKSQLEEAINQCPWAGEIERVISGGQHSYDPIKKRHYGADYWGEQWARENEISCDVYKADWRNGRQAGPIRNSLMARNADALLAVWDGKSPGTADMIAKARQYNLIVFVHRTDRPAQNGKQDG